MSVTPTYVIDRLLEEGFEPVASTGSHRLFEHHGARVVVPVHSLALSEWAAGAIEWTLEPQLGRGWLTGSPAPAPAPMTRPPEQLHLHVVLAPEQGGSGWRAFVPEEPRILTFGPTLDEARRLAEDATAMWYRNTATVVLEPVIQLDPVTRRWVEVATDPSSPPATLERARDQLADRGMTTADIDALVGATTAAA